MQALTYYVNNKKVCQVMFVNSFNLFERVVWTAMKKKEDRNLIAVYIRRKNPSYVNYNLVMLNEVKDHIKKLPVTEHNYNREGTKRQYLASNLNITEMYDVSFLQLPDTTVQDNFIEKYLTNTFLTWAPSSPKKTNVLFVWNIKMPLAKHY